MTPVGKCFITADIRSSPPFLLIGSYLCPSDPIEQQLGILEEVLASYQSVSAILMGDFNCRIGCSDPPIPPDIPLNSGLKRARCTKDNVLNLRGKALLERFIEEGLLTLNGRTKSDPLGEFTFISTLGRSLVDLTVCSLTLAPFIIDGGMLQLSSGSDHLPIFAHIMLNNHEPVLSPGPPKKYFVWNNQLKAHYNFFLRGLLQDNETITPTTLDNAISDVTRSLEMVSIRRPPRFNLKNPWFDANCRFFERCRQSALRELQRSSHAPAESRNYTFLKQMFSTVATHAKAEYFKSVSTMLNSVQNSAELWKFFRSLSPKPADPSAALDLQEVESHFISLLKKFPQANLEPFTSPPVPELENDFTLAELDCVLNKVKPNKAAGSDLISYEFYKNMNLQNRLLLLDSLNYVLRHEAIPDTWGDLKMSLLLKKGDPKSPENYRGISLLNCSAKIFTSLLANRITKWASLKSLLPECQSGFRFERSCTDNLFILQTIILEHIKAHDNWLFCAYIDFKQAFDRINHSSLWRKLSSMGLSSKLVRILASLYRKARVSVMVGDRETDPISIQNGVLQGDCLSPLLFALFIYDLESFLSSKGVDGIGMGHLWRIICLLFADDLIIFARNRIQMQRSLNYLIEYCDLNHLIINAKKSAIMVYSRREKLRIRPFSLGASVVHVESSYCYLGVTFDANGKFGSHIAEVKRKAAIAAVYISRTIAQCGRTIVCTQSKLFRAKFLACLLYGSEVFGLNSLDELESTQQRFFKRTFNLHNSTPKYVIRHFFNTNSQRLLVISKCISWFNKLVGMPNDRWPKRCLIRMISRQEDNWVYRLKQVIREAGGEWTPDATVVIPPSLLATLSTAEVAEDLRRCQDSGHCLTYAHLCTRFDSIGGDFTIAELRLALQVLLNNARFKTIHYKGASIFYGGERCEACGLSGGTVEHLLFSCGAFKADRRLCGLCQGPPSLATLIANDPAALSRLVKFVKRIWSRAVDSLCAK